MIMNARTRIGLVTASALLGASACSALTTPQSGPSAASADVAPVQFDTSAAVALPAPATKFNTALYQKTAYIHTPEGVIAFDTVTAKTLSPITAPHIADPVDADKTSKPISGTIDGTDVMLVVVPVTLPDQTAPAAMQTVDVLLIDAAHSTLIRAVTTQVPRPAANRPPPRAVAIVSGDLILNNSGSTYRISLTDGTVRWTASNFETVIIGDNGSWLIGATSRNQQAYARGVNAENGETVWTDSAAAGTRIGFNPAGPRFLVVTSENFTKVVNSATGATAATGQFPLGNDFRCFYDQQATAICSAPGTWSAALDTATGQWLWQHTADSGALAKLTTAWHGLAYGSTVSGPVILDARTGTQRLPAAAIAPLLVNGYVGIAEASPGLRAYPATTPR